jgi:quercetin dioxygenase-like cupin family protein
MIVKPIVDYEQNEVDMPGAEAVRMRVLIGPEQDARNFYMRHFEIDPGGHTPHHQHNYEHEILVLAGQGVAKSEQGDRLLKAGDVVWVPPSERHQFRNTGPEPLQIICLIPVPQECTG